MDPLPPDSARQIEDGQDDERRIDVYVRIIADDEPGAGRSSVHDEAALPAHPRTRRPR